VGKLSEIREQSKAMDVLVLAALSVNIRLRLADGLSGWTPIEAFRPVDDRHRKSIRRSLARLESAGSVESRLAHDRETRLRIREYRLVEATEDQPEDTTFDGDPTVAGTDSAA
jgi:hypothetical protein